jgi:hypothetical protein
VVGVKAPSSRDSMSKGGRGFCIAQSGRCTSLPVTGACYAVAGHWVDKTIVTKA